MEYFVCFNDAHRADLELAAPPLPIMLSTHLRRQNWLEPGAQHVSPGVKSPFSSISKRFPLAAKNS